MELFNLADYPGTKTEDTSCGAACVQLVIWYVNKGQCISSADVFWTTDIATILSKYKIKTCVLFYRSKLLSPLENYQVEDFAKTLQELITEPLPSVIKQGLVSVLDFIVAKGCIERREIQPLDIELSLKAHMPVILCVESRSFHKDDGLSGGHFVLITGEYGNNFNVISPGRNAFSAVLIDKDDLLMACHRWGGWAIFLGSDYQRDTH